MAGRHARPRDVLPGHANPPHRGGEHRRGGLPLRRRADGALLRFHRPGAGPEPHRGLRRQRHAGGGGRQADARPLGQLAVAAHPHLPHRRGGRGQDRLDLAGSEAAGPFRRHARSGDPGLRPAHPARRADDRPGTAEAINELEILQRHVPVGLREPPRGPARRRRESNASWTDSKKSVPPAKAAASAAPPTRRCESCFGSRVGSASPEGCCPRFGGQTGHAAIRVGRSPPGLRCPPYPIAENLGRRSNHQSLSRAEVAETNMKTKPTDIRPVSVKLYFLPVKTRVPLKFGPETLTQVTCARAAMTVEDRAGAARPSGGARRRLSVQWVWPSALAYEERHEALEGVLPPTGASLGRASSTPGIPWKSATRFLNDSSARLVAAVQPHARAPAEPMPWLAALVCCSAFRPGRCTTPMACSHGAPTYETYNAEFMNRDLAHYLQPAPEADGLLRRASIPADSCPRRGRAAAGLAPGRRQGPDRPGRTDRRGARRRLPGAAARLDPPRRAEVPEGQASRQRRRLGLRPPAGRSGGSPSRKGSTG